MRIEFIYDNDCPNVEAARTLLQKSLEEAGIQSEWEEWNRDSEDCPAHAKKFGSPTILVNGQDIAGMNPASDANCCRVYDHGADGLKGVPTIEMVTKALTG